MMYQYSQHVVNTKLLLWSVYDTSNDHICYDKHTDICLSVIATVIVKSSKMQIYEYS